MNFIKKLFGKKEEEPVIQAIVIPDGCAECDYCGNPIYPHEKRITKVGKKHHIRCWRQIRKAAQAMTFS